MQRSAAVYDAEIKALQQIVNAFAEQEGKGYISQKEVVRIRAQLYNFQSEYNDLINQVNDLQSELKLIQQDLVALAAKVKSDSADSAEKVCFEKRNENNLKEKKIFVLDCGITTSRWTTT